jgi:hypothetical protein
MSNPISFSLQIVGERWAYPPFVDYDGVRAKRAAAALLVPAGL